MAFICSKCRTLFQGLVEPCYGLRYILFSLKAYEQPSCVDMVQVRTFIWVSTLDFRPAQEILVPIARNNIGAAKALASLVHMHSGSPESWLRAMC